MKRLGKTIGRKIHCHPQYIDETLVWRVDCQCCSLTWLRDTGIEALSIVAEHVSAHARLARLQHNLEGTR